jgi:hypothetical protein
MHKLRWLVLFFCCAFTIVSVAAVAYQGEVPAEKAQIIYDELLPPEKQTNIPANAAKSKPAAVSSKKNTESKKDRSGRTCCGDGARKECDASW